MNSTLELPAAGASARTEDFNQSSRNLTWEYRFVVQDEWSSGRSLSELAPEGWVVVSYGIRRDSQREYLLRRPRR
jgi:hypothetical protein